MVAQFAFPAVSGIIIILWRLYILLAAAHMMYTSEMDHIFEIFILENIESNCLESEQARNLSLLLDIQLAECYTQ